MKILASVPKFISSKMDSTPSLLRTCTMLSIDAATTKKQAITRKGKSMWDLCAMDISSTCKFRKKNHIKVYAYI